jgi:predicted dehydrogenase
MTTPLRMGLVGCGFMGRAHTNAYRQVNRFFQLTHQPVLQACVARNEEEVTAFAKKWEYESYETDWRRLLDRGDIDVVDIATPNNTHCEMAVAAAEAGKMVLCEKPLATNVAEAEAMAAAVERAGVANMVWFNYRRVPAIALARQIVDEGRVGRPFHYRATYNQDWTISADVQQGGATLWRLDVTAAGSGVTGDLLAHSIDTAEWLNGPLRRVTAKTETFVKERQHVESGELQPVGIDDACMFLAEFDNGSLGTFESTRYARGRKNCNTFELNGEDGSVFFNLEDPQYLDFFEYADPHTGQKTADHLTGWRKIHVTNFEHPYMDHWWVPGCTIGYEHTFTHALADFLRGLETGEATQPDFASGLRTQRVCDAVLESSRTGQWLEVY